MTVRLRELRQKLTLDYVVGAIALLVLLTVIVLFVVAFVRHPPRGQDDQARAYLESSQSPPTV